MLWLDACTHFVSVDNVVFPVGCLLSSRSQVGKVRTTRRFSCSKTDARFAREDSRQPLLLLLLRPEEHDRWCPDY